MLDLFEKYYQLFLSNSIMEGRKYFKEVTAAYLYVLTDYTLWRKREQEDREKVAQDIFCLLEKYFSTNEELARFDRTVDLFAKVLHAEIIARGDWFLGNKQITSEIDRVFWCYGDLIYAPHYIDDYENSPIFLAAPDSVVSFSVKFITEIHELCLDYMSEIEDVLDDAKKKEIEEIVLSDIFCQLKKILNPVKINDELLNENIKFCYGHMSLFKLEKLRSLLEEYLKNFSVLLDDFSCCIDILQEITNIFVEEGCAHFGFRHTAGTRVHYNPKIDRYIVVLLYEKMALLGKHEFYLEAARYCFHIQGYSNDEQKKKEKEYYNLAAEKGVIKAYRYCDYMPEIFDKLINQNGPKYYIAYFFTYYRRMKYTQCKKYLDLIIENCSKEEKTEIGKELSSYSYEADVLAVKYLNKEIVKYKPKKERVGCYIATCVYGSYDCPEVWTLRRYRDYKLAKSWYGRVFIRLYYAVSPIIVKLFGKKGWFRKIWKGRLDGLVKKLQKEGFEGTYYKDKKW